MRPWVLTLAQKLTVSLCHFAQAVVDCLRALRPGYGRFLFVGCDSRVGLVERRGETLNAPASSAMPGLSICLLHRLHCKSGQNVF